MHILKKQSSHFLPHKSAGWLQGFVVCGWVGGCGKASSGTAHGILVPQPRAWTTQLVAQRDSAAAREAGAQSGHLHGPRVPLSEAGHLGPGRGKAGAEGHGHRQA